MGTIKEAEIFHQRPRPVIGKAVPSPIGSMNYNLLRELIEEGAFLKLQRGAEIGVFEASTSVHLLTSFSSLQLLCVDPFVEYSAHEEDKTAEKMSACESKARSRLAAFGSRATIIKNFSVQASKSVDSDSLDFVFIDAIHSFDAVTEDLHAWYRTVRPGGLVAGHDFSWPGVKEALEKFIEPLGKAAFYSPSTSDVWFFVK
jgi:hypothetical protein